MTDHERTKQTSVLWELLPVLEVPLRAALFRYFRTQPQETKEMNPQETFIFKAALRYFGEAH
jgi:hypothetical protein